MTDTPRTPVGRVTYTHQRPPYWEVTAPDGRWWSIAYNPEKRRYLITNRQGRNLDPHGPTGQKILGVVHDHERQRILDIVHDH